MADDMDDIEDMLEAPYKMQLTTVESIINSNKTEDVKTNGTNGDLKETNGNGHINDDNDSKSKELSKKSRKDRSKSNDRSSKHKKRSRSRSRSNKKSKKSRSKSREKNKGRRSRSRDRDRRRRSRTRSRTRSRSRQRKSYRSRSRSRNRSHRNSSRSRYSRTPPKRQRSPELTPEERDIRTVFCMQLSNRIRPRDLEDFFSPVGKVRDVRLITDPRTKRSKGIAYIEFRDVDSVEKAIALTGQRILGVPIIVKLTQAEKNRMPLVIPGQNAAIIPQTGPMKLYIGSLHVNINEEMLRGIFEPFGSIDAIVLCKDDFGRSKGYGYIQFSNADEAKKAMEQLNNFELANRPIKVAPFIEKTTDGLPIIANLDNDELDRTGVNLGPSGKLALMAKLAEGSGIKLPQFTIDALNMATAAAAAQTQTTQQPLTATSYASAAAAAPVATQCFLLSNMFDWAEEISKPNWDQEIREDVIEECTKYGGIVHIHIDKYSPEGNIFIKCPSISVAMAAMAGLNGRYFAGKIIRANYIPITAYHSQFSDSVNCTSILKSS